MGNSLTTLTFQWKKRPGCIIFGFISKRHVVFMWQSVFSEEVRTDMWLSNTSNEEKSVSFYVGFWGGKCSPSSYSYTKCMATPCFFKSMGDISFVGFWFNILLYKFKASMPLLANFIIIQELAMFMSCSIFKEREYSLIQIWWRPNCKLGNINGSVIKAATYNCVQQSQN